MAADVTLNQLRAFERVLRLGSFRRAADVLGLTQPSVSQRIRELESGLDVVLFERSGARAVPTAAAHSLLAYADRMLGVAQEIRRSFRVRGGVRGTLRIGMSENFALVALSELLQQLERRFPGVQASFFIGDSGQLSQQLNRRELDAAIVAEPAVDAHVEQLPIGWSRLAWFAGGHVALPRRPLTPRALAEHHLMIGPPSARLHQTVNRWFAAGGVAPARVSTCNNVAVTRLAILSGAAIGVAPARVMADDVAAGRVRQVVVRPALPPHRMAICAQRNLGDAALTSFVELAQALIVERAIFEPLAAAR